MDLLDIRLKSVKYFMNQLTLVVNGKSFDIPRSMIMGMIVNKDYFNAIYPFVYLSVNLPGWMYVEVAKNPGNISITMDLKAKFFVDNIEDMSTTSVSVYRGSYYATTAVDTPITDIDKQMKLESDADVKNKNYLFNEYYITDFCLYNTAYYQASFNSVNGVIASANMTSIVAYVLKSAGIRNTLMSRLSNNNSYREFKVAPNSGVDEIKNLIDNYGLHANGTIFFMDLDRAYLLNTSSKCEAWATNEYKITHIMSLEQYNEGIAKSSGYYSNSKEKYHLLTIEPESLQSQDLANSEFKRANYSDCIQVYTENTLFEALTPNKEFIVNIDTPSAKKINGNYQIRKVEAILSPGGEYLDPEFTITLIR